MTYVRLSKANVEIPVYESHSLRLIKLPSFRRSKVGTQTITRAGGVMRMHALKDLDLDLAEGDRVCIIGHNGAGETTLLRLIAQIYSATSGVVEFTELGEYLSLPTRVYSAGMLMRLAVALATLRAPDILLIDEGIGAGDADFQRKMQTRVQQFVGRAKILLLASHSPELCRALCNKALLLSKGRAVFFGGVGEGFVEYAKLGH